MPIYLSRYIGSGTLTDPCRPVGSDQPGWSAIDLRADGGATRDGNGLNACVLSLPVADPDPRLFQLASGKGEDLPLRVRAGLAARLNATIAYTRLDDLIAELLLRPPGNAWKPLRDRADRQLAIYLGGLLSPSPALRSLAAKIYEETWSTADNASLTSDLTWTEFLGSNWAISGNRARLAGNVDANYARADHDTDTDDQIVSAALTTLTYGGANDYFHLFCRKDGTATETFYALSASCDLTPIREWNINKVMASAYTTIATDTTDPASGDLMEISAVDSTIQGRVNMSLMLGPVTDTAITGATRAGIGAFIDGAGSVVELSNWRVMDAAQGTPFTVRQSTLRGGDVLRGVAGLTKADGSASGTAGGSGVGAAIDAAVGAVSGVAAGAGAGVAVAKTNAASAGVGTVSGSAAALSTGTGSVAGSGVSAGIASAIDTTVAASNGVGAVAAVSGATTGSPASSAGVGSATGLANAVAAAVSASVGTGTAGGDAQAIAHTAGTSTGTGAVSGAGAVKFAGVMASVGTSTVSAEGANGASTGSDAVAAGSATVSAVSGATQGSQATASGASTDSGVSATIIVAVGSASGVAVASGDSQTVTRIGATGTSAGVAVLDAVSARMWAALADASGSSSAQAEPDEPVLVGYIRVTDLSASMPYAAGVVGSLPTPRDVRMVGIPTVQGVSGSLATVSGIAGRLPTADTVRGVL